MSHHVDLSHSSKESTCAGCRSRSVVHSSGDTAERLFVREKAPDADGLIAMVYKPESKTVPVVELVNGPGRFEIPTHRNVRLLEAIGLAGECCSPGETEVRGEVSEIRGG
jgi:hypothetical protein